jgi:hypothetical protein
MSVKGITEIPGNGPNNDKKGEFKKLLGDIVASIHDRAESYFWKLIGDSPECISTLIGCEPHIMIHILGKCDLYDEDSNKFTNDIKTTSGASRRARSLLGIGKKEYHPPVKLQDSVASRLVICNEPVES